MALLDRVRSLVHGSGDILYECRVCGTKTAEDANRCVECGSSEIAALEI